MIKDWEIKDRAYVLSGSKTPLTYTISVRHSQRRPLLHFDEETKRNRELRYATNQQSLFVDEQDGYVTLEHVVFNDGALTVPRNNPVLQQLLSVFHPMAGKAWVELDAEEEAKDDIEVIEEEFEAMSLVHELDIEHLEAILRSEVGSSVNTMSSKEVKRDCYLFAKHSPQLFIDLANDEDILLRNIANRCVEAGILKLTNDNTEFQYATNGKKIFTVPFDENPYSALSRWFKTDEGATVLTNVKKKLG